jgi:hypothetical protein
MSSAQFDFLLNLVGSKIKKKNTFFRDAISAKERLALKILFLARVYSHTSVMYLFKISK